MTTSEDSLLRRALKAEPGKARLRGERSKGLDRYLFAIYLHEV
jgi:hypothetical protein